MRFKRVYIEITNICNLTCSFCAQNQRVPRRMTIEEFEHCITQIQPYTTYVYLHILGEPLAHPDLDAFLSILDTSSLQVNITTNGTLLRQQVAVLTKHRIRQINVSLHSFPQHIQPRYFEDVFTACDILASQQIYINYRLWNLHAQDEQQEGALQILTKLKEHYALVTQAIQLKRLARFTIQDYISLHFEEVFVWPSLMNPYVNDIGRCLGMKDMCGILSNGDIVPCCLDAKGDCVLGNIHTSAFLNILASERANAIVNGFQRHHVVEDLCQHCSYRLRFYHKEGT